MFRSRWMFASPFAAAALSLAPASGYQIDEPILLAARAQSNDVARVFYAGGLPVEADWTPFISNPSEPAPGAETAIAKGPDGYLYVAYFNTNRIRRYYTDGTEDCSFVFGSGTGGLAGPTDIAFNPADGAMFVVSANNRRIIRYVLSQTGVQSATTFYTLESGSGYYAAYLTFHPSQAFLFVARKAANSIWKIPAPGGVSVAPPNDYSFVQPGSGGLSAPCNMVWQVFGSGPQLLVTSSGTNSVLRFRENGQFLNQAAPSPLGEPLIFPHGLTLGPNQRLYVGCLGSDNILGYDLTWSGTTHVATYSKSHYTMGDTLLEPWDILWHSKPTAAFPIRKGQVVATYFELLHGAAVKVVDPSGTAPLGRNWLAPMFSNEAAQDPADRWTIDNLGPVFGITLDKKVPPNIYVTSSTAYGNFAFPHGPGAVFKIDGWTGRISLWLSLPNTGPALGDICYDAWHDQFFVSNFEDGKIYRVKDTPSGGVVQQAFDPFAPDDGTPGFAPRGERVWAVHMLNPSLLVFSVWLSDRGHAAPTAWPLAWPPPPIPGTPPNNALFFGLVDASGELFTVGSSGLLGPVVMPFYAGHYSNPVSDITGTLATSSDKQFVYAAIKGLLVSERTFIYDYGVLNYGSSAHQARVMSFAIMGNPARWARTGVLYNTGIHPNDCAGGIATDPKGDVWATADAIRANFPFNEICDRLYGLHRMPKSGGNGTLLPTNYYDYPSDVLIDLDHNTIGYDKSSPGDVEYYDGPNPPSGCNPCN